MKREVEARSCLAKTSKRVKNQNQKRNTHAKNPQTNSESKKSTAIQIFGPHYSTTSRISSGEFSCAKTLIEYDNGKTLEIKGETTQDQHSASSNSNNVKNDPKKSTDRPDSAPYTVLHCSEFLEFETVFVKQEKEEQNAISEGNQLDEPCITTKISSGNNSSAKDLPCLIEYDNDESLDIKEEVIQDQGTVTGQKFDEKHEWKQKKQKIHKSKQEPEKKYKCEKCARTYKQKYHLTQHRKYECNVIPKFNCNFCSKRFAQKSSMLRHVGLVHLKTDSKPPILRHDCDKCSQSYRSVSGLNQHKRSDHAIGIQFNCDICDYKTKRKPNLSRHMTAMHLPK
ncbi:zinc finger protein 184-like [Belonocnema kinseyi]|uniref:zinc finger protein 184-like n=1 Tax=Belonocnema kinseyi TaxID=2817044 RepID=UPI00143DD948|nr:zinc finger protein 184-like [Belonocnema kinseyi]